MRVFAMLAMVCSLCVAHAEEAEKPAVALVAHIKKVASGEAPVNEMICSVSPPHDLSVGSEVVMNDLLFGNTFELHGVKNSAPNVKEMFTKKTDLTDEQVRVLFGVFAKCTFFEGVGNLERLGTPKTTAKIMVTHVTAANVKLSGHVLLNLEKKDDAKLANEIDVLLKKYEALTK